MKTCRDFSQMVNETGNNAGSSLINIVYVI